MLQTSTTINPISTPSFLPLDDGLDAGNDDDEEQDTLPASSDDIQAEEDEFLRVVEDSPIDKLTNKVLRRLRKGRGAAPVEYTERKTFWVAQTCPSFRLQTEHDNNGWPVPDSMYTPRLFLWFPQHLTKSGCRLACPDCDGSLNSNAFMKPRRIIDVNE